MCAFVIVIVTGQIKTPSSCFDQPFVWRKLWQRWAGTREKEGKGLVAERRFLHQRVRAEPDMHWMF